MSATPPDLVAAVDAAATRVRGTRYELRWFPILTSTMDVAQEAARTGGREGLVVVADEQTSGRGRRGRMWSSPAGAGLYLSIVFRPSPARAPASALSLFTLAAGVAVREAIARASGLRPDLKWPNDVIVNRRKLAGILTEGSDIGSAGQTVVLGIGINVLAAAQPPDVAARSTSLETEVSRNVDRALLLEEVLVAVAQRYSELCAGNTDDILREWRAASPSVEGARVKWPLSHGSREGVTKGVDDRGALLVETSDGTERVLGGELIWLES